MKNPLAMNMSGTKPPPPPPPPEPAAQPTPEEIEAKRRLEEEAKAKQAVKRRLDEAKSRLGKLSPQLIEDVRLLCNAFVDEVATKNYADENGRPLGIPFEAVRRDLIARAPSCPCSQYLINAERG
jgi:hypothetical protein